MLKVEYNDNIEDEYYKLISNIKMRKHQNITFEDYYNKYIKYKIGYELKNILCGDFEVLTEIKLKLGTKYQKNNDIKNFFNYDKSKGKLSKLQPKISTFFEKNIKLDTCYFCNIDFINRFKLKDEKYKNGFTLDHFFDKAKYPYLALSLYNLIPSCYICNTKIKGSKFLKSVSPTSKKFDFKSKVKFKTFMKNKDLKVEKVDDFDLLLREDFTSEYEQYIETLGLDGRYEYHKYKILELIEKRRTYPDSRIKELAKISKKTEEDVKQDLFGKYLVDALYKRPLGKLINDISQELGLLL